MQTTTNYGYNVPESGDAADITKIAQNFVDIDSDLKEVADTVNNTCSDLSGKIDEVGTKVDGVGTKVDSIQTTVDTLPEKVEQKLDPVQTDMAQLVENVQKQVDELRTIVENSPAGVLPPSLSSFSCNSTEDGINVTYLPNVTVMHNGETTTDNNSDILSMTKGIMFRYSDEKYPTNIDEGVFAFNDEDIFRLTDLGGRQPKQKNNTITGLTNGKTYYISAFPYSYGNRYYIGSRNCRKSCQWTGTKGTLTVNVTQDYDYKPLGEYTATLTPTAGGQAITKTQSGAGTVVFSGLESGQYTLSFSAPQYFTAPSSQSVTVVAGQSQTISVEYEIFKGLSNYSWQEIGQIASSGWHDEIFSVGDTKTFQGTDDKTYTVELAAKNHNYANNSGTQLLPLTFVAKEVYDETCSYADKSSTPVPYNNSNLKNAVENIYNFFPQELKNVIKPTYRKEIRYNSSNGWTADVYQRMIWVPSLTEMSGLTTIGSNTNALTAERNNGHSKFALYTNNSRRIKKIMGTNTDANYWTSTCYTNQFCATIINNGGASGVTLEALRNPVFAFCI